MGYCPLWVLGVVSAHATRQYVDGYVPLLSYATQYSELLNKHYENTSKLKIMAICEEYMSFLVEIDADDILGIFDSYIFYRTCYDTSGKPRKIKTMFKNAFASVNEDPSVDEVVKAFRVFTFRYRSNEAVVRPDGWILQDVENIGWLGDLFDLEVNNSGSLSFE